MCQETETPLLNGLKASAQCRLTDELPGIWRRKHYRVVRITLPGTTYSALYLRRPDEAPVFLGETYEQAHAKLDQMKDPVKALAARHQEINQLLNGLNEYYTGLLQQSLGPAEVYGPITWAAVGDAAHVADILKEAVAFVMGVEPDELPAPAKEPDLEELTEIAEEIGLPQPNQLAAIVAAEPALADLFEAPATKATREDWEAAEKKMVQDFLDGEGETE